MKIILLTLLATSLVQLGYFLWKVVADDLPRLGEVKLFVALKAYFSSWKWTLGMALRVTGLILFIKATSIGDISLVQPLMFFGDIFFVILVCVFLHERLVKLEWVGLCITFVGTVGISFEAKTLDPAAIDWFRIAVFFSVAIMVLMCFILLAKKNQKSEVFWGLAIGMSYGVGAVLIKLMTSSLVLSGQAVNFVNFVFNPLFPCIIVANILGLVFLQMGFQNGRAAVIFPVHLSVVIGVAVLAGVLLFSETVSLYRLACILVIVIGTVLFQYSANAKKH